MPCAVEPRAAEIFLGFTVVLLGAKFTWQFAFLVYQLVAFVAPKTVLIYVNRHMCLILILNFQFIDQFISGNFDST